ncbi:restriction endonuclease [Streptomyces sp. NPDC058739]|uniref:restriction endonuclease n=1 Tax=Streptomyces sp. NPDC058739 TaxID=3346618 RepID=UPI0036AE84E8
MTTPARRIRRIGRRRFDLRATAVYFGLLALVVCVAGLAVRTAVATIERRPVWGVALGLVAASSVPAMRRRRRGASVAGAAQRAAEALEAATDTALHVLDAEAVHSPPPTQHEPHDDGLDRAGTGERRCSAVDHDALDADEFEQAVAALCERDGCAEVEVVGGAGDLGADVLAVTPDGQRLVIQCKRYDVENRVGSQDLQRFGGTCYAVHEADLAVLVTTSDFTAPAAEYAEQCGILCLDGEALKAWSDGTGPAPWTAVSR